MSAMEILFERPFKGNVLFKKQSELVLELLNTPESHYFTEQKERDKYDKEFIRLKTLISQLLSPTVHRNIPSEFPDSLKAVINKKIQDFKLSEEIVNELIKDLKLQNDFHRNDNRQISIIERLKSDFNTATYIAIIISNPLEIESTNINDRFSIRNLFIDDFFSTLMKRDIVSKKYRLLLPLETSCILFWKGFKEIVFNFIKQNRNDTTLIKNLYAKFSSSSRNQPELFSTELPTDSDINDLTIKLLTFLNKEGYLVVFCHTSPLFNLPLIAINPADFKESKIYILLENEKDSPFIHQYSSNETVFWRFFVWDRIKTKHYSGIRIDFASSILNIGDD